MLVFQLRSLVSNQYFNEYNIWLHYDTVVKNKMSINHLNNDKKPKTIKASIEKMDIKKLIYQLSNEELDRLCPWSEQDLSVYFLSKSHLELTKRQK